MIVKVFRVCVVLVLVFLAAFSDIHAQLGTIKFQQVTSANGLSYDFVHTIVRDRIGYMWFGTRAGLNRYDGFEMQVFQNNLEDSLSICANGILDSYCDSKGDLWFGTADGLARYDYENQNFRNYYLPHMSEGDMIVNCLGEDKNQNLWVGTANGLYAKEASNDYLRPISTLQPLLSKLDSIAILDLFFRDEYLFVATANDGLWRLDSKGLFPVIWKTSSNEWEKIYSNRVQNVLVDINGDVVTSYGDGTIERRDIAQKTLYTYTELNLYERGDVQNELSEIMLDNQGNLWVSCSLSGLSLYDRSSNSFIHLKDVPGITAFDNTRSARSMYVDNQGTIWLAMHTSGILYFNIIRQSFINYQRSDGISDAETDESLLSNWTRTFAEGIDNSLWVGTTDGISILDRKNQVFSALRNETKTDEVLSNNSIRSLLNVDDRFMLIGTAKGLTRYDFKSGKSINYYPDIKNPLTLCGGFVYDIQRTSNGDIYLCTNKGLCRYNVDTEIFYNWIETPEIKEVFKEGNRGLAIDKNDVLWIAVGNGDIVEYHPTESRIRKHIGLFSHDEASRNTTLDMLNDDSLIWIGSMGGLIKFNKRSGVFVVVDFGDNPPPLVVGNMWKDQAGVLWFTGSTGMIRYNTITEEAEYFDVHHGLPTNSFHFQHSFKTHDGFLCMASLKGVVMFKPENIEQLIFHPKAHITELRVLNEIMSLSVISDDYLSLNHDQNFLNITLNTFEYLNQENMRYAYMLEGLNDDWIFNGKNRNLTFTNLPGGDYVLKFKTTTSDGVWPEEFQILRIHVSTVFYRTWWFLTGMAMLFLGLIYLIVRYRQNQRLKVEWIRQKIASDLHDDIGSTLSSIRMYSEIAIGNDEKASPLLRKISDNAGLIVDSMSDMVWAIKPGNEKLGDLRNKMESFSKEMCSPLEIVLMFHFDPSLEEIKVNMEYKKDIYLVFKESLNNAIKYGQCSKIEVSVKSEQHHLILEVKDNGVGFDVSTIQKGNGLDNIKMRISKLKGEMNIDSKEGVGTSVLFKVRLTHIG